MGWTTCVWEKERKSMLRRERRIMSSLVITWLNRHALAPFSWNESLGLIYFRPTQFHLSRVFLWNIFQFWHKVGLSGSGLNETLQRRAARIGYTLKLVCPRPTDSLTNTPATRHSSTRSWEGRRVRITHLPNVKYQDMREMQLWGRWHRCRVYKCNDISNRIESAVCLPIISFICLSILRCK